MKLNLRGVGLGCLTLLSLSGVASARQDTSGTKPFTERDLHFTTHVRMTCATFDLEDQTVLMARVEDVGARRFFVVVDLPGLGQRLLGHGMTDAEGVGEAYFSVPSMDPLPANTEIEFIAYSRDERGRFFPSLPVPYLANPKPTQTLDFDWPLDGSPALGGTVIDDQWAGAGITVQAVNPAGMDLAILFDSDAPSLNDPDLVTPGMGPNNHSAQGKLLVVAGNAGDYDADGVIDIPDSADTGGLLVFEFEQEVLLNALELVDIDSNEAVVVRTSYPGHHDYDVRIPDLGNLLSNNQVCMGFTAEPLTRLEIQFSGNGGIAKLSYLPVDAVVDFDRTMTGIPLGLLSGAQLAQQFTDDLGFAVRGDAWLGSLPDAAVLMDTAHPAPLDRDLRTPGTHPTNTVYQGLALILPQNVRDADLDGLVDLPDSNNHGGILSFEFEYDVVFESAGLLDVDECEDSWIELFGGAPAHARIAAFPIPRLGNGSWLELSEALSGTVYPGVRRIDFVLDGSAAVTNLRFRRDTGQP